MHFKTEKAYVRGLVGGAFRGRRRKPLPKNVYYSFSIFVNEEVIFLFWIFLKTKRVKIFDCINLHILNILFSQESPVVKWQFTKKKFYHQQLHLPTPILVEAYLEISFSNLKLN